MCKEYKGGDVLAAMSSKCSCGENANIFEEGEQCCGKCYLKKHGRR